MKKLISLKQHNRKKLNEYQNKKKPKRTGIACPECKEELWLKNPEYVHRDERMNMPPQTESFCKKCMQTYYIFI